MSLHIDWPSFPTFVWNFSSLCLLLQYLSCPIWILILEVSPQCQALSHYLEEVHRTGPRLLSHNHQTLFYCCNSHLQMGTCRTPPSFSFCSQVVPLDFLVRNCGQWYSCAILKAVKNQAAYFPLPAIQMLKLRWLVVYPHLLGYCSVGLWGQFVIQFCRTGCVAILVTLYSYVVIQNYTAAIIFPEFTSVRSLLH